MAYRVLISGGGCEEPLDAVRFLANFSTGQTAISLAQHFKTAGFEVTLVASHRMDVTGVSGEEILRYRTYSDLSFLMKQLLSKRNFDLVIQAAAVSDYRIDSIEVDGQIHKPDVTGKINSSGDLKLTMKRNEKIIDRFRDWSQNHSLKIVAFKLTSSASEDEINHAVGRILTEAHPDWIVWNDLAGITGQTHRARIYNDHKVILAETETKKELAEGLERLFLHARRGKEGERG